MILGTALFTPRPTPTEMLFRFFLAISNEGRI
jgi:hypothetical protein